MTSYADLILQYRCAHCVQARAIAQACSPQLLYLQVIYHSPTWLNRSIEAYYKALLIPTLTGPREFYAKENSPIKAWLKQLCFCAVPPSVVAAEYPLRTITAT